MEQATTTVPPCWGTFPQCTTLSMLQKVAWRQSWHWWAKKWIYKKKGKGVSDGKDVSGRIDGALPSLPKVAPVVLERLIPLASRTLCHVVGGKRMGKWRKENFVARERQEQQSMCVVGKNNQQSTYMCSMATRRSNNNNNNIWHRTHSIEQKQFSFCQCMTQQEENKTTGGARSATVISTRELRTKWWMPFFQAVSLLQ